MSDLFIRPLFTWRSAMASPNGPKSPITRLVLLTLSLHMSERGDSCFPSTRTIAEESALSHRSVIDHLALAVIEGWIGKKERRTNGKGWRRMEYVAQIPQGFENIEAEGKSAGTPEQHRAWKAVANALAKGNLLREPCEKCGSEDTDAHHDDYSKPLVVRWLCRKHHGLFHAKHGDESGASRNGDAGGASASDGDESGAHRGASDDTIVVREVHQSTTSSTSLNKEKAAASRATSIPPDFSISESIRDWAKKKGYAQYLDAHFEWFVDYAKANPAKRKYVDWDAAFRNCVTSDWGDIRKNWKGGAAPRVEDRSCQENIGRGEKCGMLAEDNEKFGGQWICRHHKEKLKHSGPIPADTQAKLDAFLKRKPGAGAAA